MRQLPLVVVLCLSGGLLFWNFSFYRVGGRGSAQPAIVHASPRPAGTPQAARLETPLQGFESKSTDEKSPLAATRRLLAPLEPVPLVFESELAIGRDASGHDTDAVSESYPNGRPRARGDSYRGRRTGRWIEWFENGEIKSHGEYLDGVRVGDWVFWQESGRVAAEGSYVDGQREGTWSSWHAGGELASQAEYHRSVPNGPWRVFHTNGQIKESGTYNMGLREGLWEFFDYHGRPNPLRTGMYVAGIPVD